MHSISEEELAAFAEHINTLLCDEVDLASRLPIDTASTSAIFEACKDGVLFAKLVNKVDSF